MNPASDAATNDGRGTPARPQSAVLQPGVRPASLQPASLRPARRPLRRLLVGIAAATLMLGLAACSSGGAGFVTDRGWNGVSGNDSSSGGAPEWAPDMGDREDGAAPTQDRQIIVTGSVWIIVDDPTDAADETTRMVERAGGHVDRRSETTARETRPGHAELTVRIPATALNSTLDDIAELGDVRERNISRSDVTSVARDLDARITALETSVDRLLALMAQATTTADLITIESTLSERQADLESLQAQRRDIADRVDYSTITLTLQSVVDAPAEEPDTFLTGLIAGWNAFVSFVSFLLVAAGVLLPWLIVAGLLALIVGWLLRRRMRSRRARSAAEIGTGTGTVSGTGHADLSEEDTPRSNG